MSAVQSGRILVVDDDPALLRMWMLMLGSLGHAVEGAADGTQAIESFRRNPHDVIVTDVSMPGMSGLDLLELVRQHDADVPVVVVTGAPELDGASVAVELRAFRYISKPVSLEAFRTVVGLAMQAAREAKEKKLSLEAAGVTSGSMREKSAVGPEFNAALNLLWMAYQPIVQWSSRRIIAFEALVRSHHQGMRDPAALFDAADQLDRASDLDREIRRLTPQPLAQTEASLFVNMSTRDFVEMTPLAPDSLLAPVASRIVLEITERASIESVPDARAKIALLRARGFRIALDDVGSGYSNLTSFTMLEPDVMKLDMALVRNVDKSETKQALVRSMVSLAQELGSLIIAEGVETQAECLTLLQLGCDCFQGYLFARPGPPFPTVNWDAALDVRGADSRTAR